MNFGRKFYTMCVAQLSWIFLLMGGFLDMDHFSHLTNLTLGGYFIVNGATKWSPK